MVPGGYDAEGSYRAGPIGTGNCQLRSAGVARPVFCGPALAARCAGFLGHSMVIAHAFERLRNEGRAAHLGAHGGMTMRPLNLFFRVLCFGMVFKVCSYAACIGNCLVRSR